MAAKTAALSKEGNAEILRDGQSVVTAVVHSEQPVSVGGTTARAAAENYLRTQGSLLGVAKSELAAGKTPAKAGLRDRGVEYRFVRVKAHAGLTTVIFEQTYLGLPIWEAGIAVHLKRQPPPPNRLKKKTSRQAGPYQVIGCQSTRHDEVSVTEVEPRAGQLARLKTAIARVKKLEPPILARQLGITLKGTSYDSKSLEISHERVVIYRYRAKERVRGLPTAADSKTKKLDPQAMRLPAVSNAIAEGSHHVVAAVYFDLAMKGHKPTHWVALVEVDTLSILYLEPLAAGLKGSKSRRAGRQVVRGKVFRVDPKTQDKNAPGPGAGPNVDLDKFREWVELRNLKTTSPQELSGSNIRIVNYDNPRTPAASYDPPTEPAGTDFEYPVRTNQFAAVNAYFHCDGFFNMVEDFGFTRASYFPGTDFPIEVDHRGSPSGKPNGVCAQCRALTKVVNGGHVKVGIDKVVFALARPFVNPPVGIAADWRTVLHELGGHGTLQNHIQSSFFKFAHSAGDSFAAILNDPESKAADRFQTFPWLYNDIQRRHDRKWRWGGPEDQADGNTADQLVREEILSSTHFRLYQAIGGDADNVDVRRDAAQYTAYLMLRAIFSLDAATSPNNAEEWMTSLVMANEADWPTKGYAGGAYGKVIRWAFEQQGVFDGHPPLGVDVYIDDGRKGEYTYQNDWTNCSAIWNRHAGDGQNGHQAPIPNVVNYAYVTVKNRGTQNATSVRVDAFQSASQNSRDWPNDWKATKTPQCAAADVPPQPAGVKVGPFEWIPSAGANVLLMAVSADLDPNNLGKFSANRSIPDWRLVPHDNNLAMRKM